MSCRQTGSCPKCGAAIYLPEIWMGIFPPSPVYSCACHKPETQAVTTIRIPTTANGYDSTQAHRNLLRREARGGRKAP